MTTSLILPACTENIVATKAPEDKCAIPEYAEMNSQECGRNGAANSRMPNLSFDGVSTTEGVVGKLMSIKPSRLEGNGSDIKACKITPDLPTGLTINSATCVISGTPTAVVASTTYAVIATNLVGSSRPAKVTIKVGAAAPNLSYSGATGTNATVGSLMSVTPTTLSVNGASITSCAVKTGTTALPSWASVNAATCVISGTPNAVLSNTSYTIVATNSVGQSADAAVTLSVAAAVPSLSYSNSSGRIGTVNTPMTITPSTFSANGASITGCAVKLGTTALPAWASLNTTTCVISGTPNAVMASKSYTLVATNSVGQSADAAISLSVAAIPSLSYSGASGRNGTFGTLMTVNPTTLSANEASITACGIKVPTTALPSWASVNPTTCVISGTPNAVLASTTYTLVATNSVGQSADATVTLSVAAVVPALSYSNSSGRSGTVNTPMTVTPSTLSANGAQITGCAVKTGTTALPPWASVNATTCVISGTPNGSLNSTTYTIVATNSVGQSADALVSLSVGTNILTPIAIEAFPDTTNHPAVTWTPNVRFSSVTNDNIGLYSDTLGTLINNPVTATAGLNTFLANPVTSLGQTNTVYAKNPSSSSYTTMGTYRTMLPPSFAISGVSGTVNAVVKDQRSSGCTIAPGCMIIGGSFSAIGSKQTNNIVRIKADGTFDVLGGGVNGTVYAISVDSSGSVYVGGSFTMAGVTTANRLAKWNGSTWSAMGTGLNNNVLALAIDGAGRLYVGGDFTTAGSINASKIARWDGSSWSALSSGMNLSVRALTLDSSGNLYAGGSFTTAGSLQVNRVAKWSANAWSALGIGLDDTVSVLAISPSGTLFAGGRFFNSGGVQVRRIGKWNGTSWEGLGNGLPTTIPVSLYSYYDAVNAIEFDSSGVLYAAGNIADETTNRIIAAKWNGSSWTAIDTSLWQTSIYTPKVNGLAFDASGNLYAGGNFTVGGGSGSLNIAKFNGTSWGGLGGGLNGHVSAIVFDNSGNVYIGGSFTTVGGISANNVAKWNGSSWSTLGSGMNGPVMTLILDSSGNLFAGGSFTTAGGVTANYVAKWNRSSWESLGSGMQNITVNAFDAAVYTLKFSPSGNLYAGGRFTDAGGVTANGVAQWNGSSWFSLGPGIGGTVTSLAFDAPGNLYAGGSFDYAGYGTKKNIAMWNGTSWIGLGTGLNSYVLALAFDAVGNLYVGGDFTTANGSSANYIAKWSGTSWSALSTGMNGSVSALALDSAGSLYAGGNFTISGGLSALHIAKWDGSSWSTLNSGVNGGVSSLTFDPNGNLYATGNFTNAGGMLRPFLAKWLTVFSSWF